MNAAEKIIANGAVTGLSQRKVWNRRKNMKTRPTKQEFATAPIIYSAANRCLPPLDGERNRLSSGSGRAARSFACGESSRCARNRHRDLSCPRRATWLCCRLPYTHASIPEFRFLYSPHCCFSDVESAVWFQHCGDRPTQDR